MSVKAIRMYEVPRSQRRRESPIQRTRDWIDTLDAIKKEDFEALQVEFSPETLSLGSATPDRFRRLLLRELDRMGRRDVNVKFRGTNESGDPILYVVREYRPKMMTVYAPGERIRAVSEPKDRGVSTPANEAKDSEVKRESGPRQS